MDKFKVVSFKTNDEAHIGITVGVMYVLKPFENDRLEVVKVKAIDDTLGGVMTISCFECINFKSKAGLDVQEWVSSVSNISVVNGLVEALKVLEKWCRAETTGFSTCGFFNQVVEDMGNGTFLTKAELKGLIEKHLGDL